MDFLNQTNRLQNIFTLINTTRRTRQKERIPKDQNIWIKRVTTLQPIPVDVSLPTPNRVT